MPEQPKMELPALSKISTDTIPPSFTGANCRIDVLRLDKIHPVISGNKWFKLHKYLEIARTGKKKRIASFGGPWSNHIIATAAAAMVSGFASLGFIRGEQTSTLNPILQQCRDMGMELVFIPRKDFDEGMIPDGILTADDLLIPMGGFGIPGMEGAGTILSHGNAREYSHICCAVGTGTMMAGLMQAANPGQQIIGYSAVKNDPELERKIRQLIPGHQAPVEFSTDQQFGGFAKYNEELIRFMNDLYDHCGIPTDIVYTAKLFYYAIRDARSGRFAEASRILLIHSGGSTGNLSLKNGMLIW